MLKPILEAFENSQALAGWKRCNSQQDNLKNQGLSMHKPIRVSKLVNVSRSCTMGDPVLGTENPSDFEKRRSALQVKFAYLIAYPDYSSPTQIRSVDA
jgi:hypothetical protein